MDDLLFGLRMTVVGMGTVFLLLAALMGLLLLLGRLDRPAAADASGVGSAPDDPHAADEAPDAVTTGGDAPTLRIHAHGLTDDQVAAIAVAVTRHAEMRRRRAAPETRRFEPGSQLHASRWVALGRAHQSRPSSRS